MCTSIIWHMVAYAFKSAAFYIGLAIFATLNCVPDAQSNTETTECAICVQRVTSMQQMWCNSIYTAESGNITSFKLINPPPVAGSHENRFSVGYEIYHSFSEFANDKKQSQHLETSDWNMLTCSRKTRTVRMLQVYLKSNEVTWLLVLLQVDLSWVTWTLLYYAYDSNNNHINSHLYRSTCVSWQLLEQQQSFTVVQIPLLMATSIFSLSHIQWRNIINVTMLSIGVVRVHPWSKPTPTSTVTP